MILGLNWLNHYQANIKCHEKLVEVTAPSGDKLSVEVTMQPPPTALVTQVQMGGTQAQDDGNSSVDVVDEFPDVFPEDLLGMPPD